MKIKLDIKPLTINKAWQGRRFKTPLYKQYENDCKILLLPYKNKNMVKGYVQVNYTFYLKYWKTTDYSNLIKCLQDIIVKNHLIEDDRKILKSTQEKVASEKDWIKIEIIRLGDYE